jgi:hypothetical protein
MQLGTRSSAEEQPDKAPAPGRPPCPVCSGPLLPLRDFYRCSRCGFSICAGCEGADSYPPADGGA